MSYGTEQSQSRWKRFQKRLQHRYRLIVMNDETFEEVSSNQITLLNVWVLVSTVVVSVAAIVIGLIMFTPLQRYVIGYNEGANAALVYELNGQIETLEKQLAQQKNYTEQVRKMLVGKDLDTEELEQIEEELEEEPMTDLTPVLPSKADSIIRQQVADRQFSNLTKSGGSFIPVQPSQSLEQVYLMAPVSGTISAGFMPERQHFGVDVLAPKNTPIMAIMDGYVIFSDWTLETGNTIAIQHENDIVSIYKHNSARLKELNSQVKAGEAVAIIGNTGTLSDGPHLHFELWYQGKAVDPTAYINF